MCCSKKPSGRQRGSQRTDFVEQEDEEAPSNASPPRVCYSSATSGVAPVGTSAGSLARSRTHVGSAILRTITNNPVIRILSYYLSLSLHYKAECFPIAFFLSCSSPIIIFEYITFTCGEQLTVWGLVSIPWKSQVCFMPWPAHKGPLQWTLNIGTIASLVYSSCSWNDPVGTYLYGLKVVSEFHALICPQSLTLVGQLQLREFLASGSISAYGIPCLWVRDSLPVGQLQMEFLANEH